MVLDLTETHERGVAHRATNHTHRTKNECFVLGKQTYKWLGVFLGRSPPSRPQMPMLMEDSTRVVPTARSSVLIGAAVTGGAVVGGEVVVWGREGFPTGMAGVENHIRSIIQE